MTPLKKIIDKAVSGGFDLLEFMEIHPDGQLTYEYKKSPDRFWAWFDVIGVKEIDKIIFSHDFLKAFFGGKDLYVCPWCAKNPELTTPEKDRCDCEIVFPVVYSFWQYHAQQLVLSEDRLKYLMRFV